MTAWLLGSALGETARFTWVQAGRSSLGGYAGGRGLTLDAARNIHFTAFYSGEITIGSRTLTNAGLTDVFLAKCSPSGEILSLIRGGGPNGELSNGLAVGETGDVYVTGHYGFSTQFGNIRLLYTTNFTWTAGAFFIAKLAADGAFEWADGTGSGNNSAALQTLVDRDGDVWMVAAHGGIHTAKYAPDGRRLWRQTWGDAVSNYGWGIGLQPDNGCVVFGYFSLPTLQVGDFLLTRQSNRGRMLAKVDPTGKVIWAKTLYKPDRSPFDLFPFTMDKGGNCFIAGSQIVKCSPGGGHHLVA